MKKSNLKKYLKDKYKAVIIGAGKIAAQFDSPKSKSVLTHAHAFKLNSRTELAGFFDINRFKAKAAGKKWDCPVFGSLEEMFKKVSPDIVSICTPDKDHFSVLMKISKYKPRLVICEKPIVASLKEGEIISKKSYKILVNYSRRFDETMQKLKQEIDRKQYGKILCSSGIYNKGLKHSGSHMVDLCRFLFGEVEEVKPSYNFRDYTISDKSVGGFLRFKKCPQFYLMIADARKYEIFELDIVFEKARIRLYEINTGVKISWQNVKKNNEYKDYKKLGEPKILETKTKQVMFNLIDNAVKYLDGKEPLRCGVKDAREDLRICELLSK